MAKDKNSSMKDSSRNTSRNSTRNSSGSQTRSSVKDSHAQVPDNSPGRSGPGGE